MKKNFFKKLSFVMALAMMISVIAPAAGAFAAAKPALNATSKTLLLGNADRSEFDFNVKNTVKGASYKWASSNKAVATVAKNGLTTAVGTGSTKVSVKITKSGKTTTLTAKVVVKDNIAAITEIVAPAGADVAKLAVATDYDFGRKFKTESGSTTKTTSVTRWVVSSTDATITDAGVFKAAKAGKYTITAVAFQSAAKYTAWVAAGSDLKSSAVLASKALEVTVANSIVSVKQVDPSTVAVTFDADMSGTDLSKTTANVYQVINGKDVVTSTTKVKSLTLDTTGKIATVVLFADLTADTTYNFVYGTLSSTFTSAKVSLSDVASITVKNFSVSDSTAHSILPNVCFLNKDGVILFYGDDTVGGIAASTFLTFTYDGDLTKGTVAGSDAYVYSMGYAAPFTAKFTANLLDSATSTYKTVTFTASGTVARKTAAEAVGSYEFSLFTAANFTDNYYALMSATYAPVIWYLGSTKLAKGENVKISAKVTIDGTTTYEANSSRFYYKSSNDSIALVNGNDLYAAAAGTVTIVVYDKEYKTTYNTEKVVTSFDVTVVESRTIATLTQDLSNVTVSNNANVTETKTVTIGAKDTLDQAAKLNDAAKYAVTSSWVTTPASGTASVVITKGTTPSTTGDKIGEAYVAVSMANVPVGTYQLKVNITDLTNDVTKPVFVYVTVVDGSSATISYYRLETNKTSVDLNGNYGEALTVAMYGYNQYNAKCAVLDSTYYDLAVVNTATDVDTSTLTAANFAYTTTSVPVVVTTGSAVANYAVGTYKLTAKLNATGATALTSGVLGSVVSGTSIGSTTLTVVDTTAKTLTLDKYVVTTTNHTILEAVAAAYSTMIKYVPVDDVAASGTTDGISKIVYSTGAAEKTDGLTATYTVGTSIRIVSITYRIWNSTDTAYKDYTFYPGNSISVN